MFPTLPRLLLLSSVVDVEFLCIQPIECPYQARTSDLTLIINLILKAFRRTKLHVIPIESSPTL